MRFERRRYNCEINKEVIMIKAEILNQYDEEIDNLEIYLSRFSEEVIGFKPNIEDSWSIAEHLRHLLDVELNQFLLVNDILINNVASNVKDVNIDNLIDFCEGMDIYKKLRSEILQILKDERFKKDKCKIKSSVHGLIEMEFKEGIQALNNHLKVHKDFMKRNVEEYSKRESN
jgi:DinB superfamily